MRKIFLFLMSGIGFLWAAAHEESLLSKAISDVYKGHFPKSKDLKRIPQKEFTPYYNMLRWDDFSPEAKQAPLLHVFLKREKNKLNPFIAGIIKTRSKNRQARIIDWLNAALLYEYEGDSDAAIAQYHKITKHNFMEAHYRLGKIYSLRHKRKNATHHLTIAQKAGHLKATFALAQVLYHSNLARSLALHLEAAHKGYAKSQYAVGVYFENGWGIGKNSYGAKQWFLQAAKQHYPRALCKLGLSHYSPDDAIGNTGEAEKYFRPAAQLGHALSQFYLGDILYRKNNFEEAAHFFKLASAQGVAEATERLSQLYFFGLGVEQDHIKSAKLKQRADSIL